MCKSIIFSAFNVKLFARGARSLRHMCGAIYNFHARTIELLRRRTICANSLNFRVPTGFYLRGMRKHWLRHKKTLPGGVKSFICGRTSFVAVKH